MMMILLLMLMLTMTVDVYKKVSRQIFLYVYKMLNERQAAVKKEL
jgi:hypothetical protein